MANFCKYCGTELSEGKECQCEGAIKERESMSERAEQEPKTAQSSVYSSVGKGTSDLAILDFLKQVMVISKAFLLNPLETMKIAFKEEDKKNQFITGGVMMIIIWILFYMMIKTKYVPAGIAFKYTLMGTLFYGITRLAYGFGVYFFIKDREKKYMELLGLSSITLVMDTVIIAILLILRWIGFYEMFSIGILVLFASTVINAFAIAYVAIGEDIGKAYKITLLLQIIFIIVTTFVAMAYIRSEVLSTMGNMFRGFSGFGF